MRAIAKGSFEALDSNHHRGSSNNFKGADGFQRTGDRAIGSVMQHQDEGHARAFVTFRLNDRGNTDLCVAEDFSDSGQCAGDIDDIEPYKIARDYLVERYDRAIQFVGNERWNAVFGAELQVERGVGHVA